MSGELVAALTALALALTGAVREWVWMRRRARLTAELRRARSDPPAVSAACAGCDVQRATWCTRCAEELHALRTQGGWGQSPQVQRGPAGTGVRRREGGNEGSG